MSTLSRLEKRLKEKAKPRLEERRTLRLDPDTYRTLEALAQEKALDLTQGRPPGGGGSWRGGGRGGHGPIRGGDRQAASQNARGRQGREGVDREGRPESA